MKKLLFTGLIALFAMSANAQFNYVFSKHTSLPYVPLTSGTSINGSDIWDDEIYPVPLPFNFDMDGITTDTAWLNMMSFLAADSAGLTNSFLFLPADCQDKGADTSTMSHSPVRYQVTGTTPNRIVKMEVANAGFYDEFSDHNTADDSLSVQVWLYETSNIVDIRFGPRYLQHASEYLLNDSNKISIGYLHQFDIDLGTLDMFYYAEGDTSAPTIDSTNNINGAFGVGINAWPTLGTVYRFEPPTVSVKNAMAALKQVTVYPTAATEEVYIENASNEAIHYTVVSMNGASVNMSGKLSNGKNLIDISHLAAGTYVVRLSNDKIGKAVKFTKL